MKKNLFVHEGVAIDLSHVVASIQVDSDDPDCEDEYRVYLENQNGCLILNDSGQAFFDALVAYWESL